VEWKPIRQVVLELLRDLPDGEYLHQAATAVTSLVMWTRAEGFELNQATLLTHHAIEACTAAMRIESAPTYRSALRRFGA
jgi:hypothetical protein